MRIVPFAFFLPAIMSAVAVIASCKVNQEKEVALYREVLDRGMTQGEAIAEKQELGVADTMALASLRNESLAIEGEDYLQALIDQRRAAANFLPTLTLSPSYAWRENTGGGDSDDDFGSGDGGRRSREFNTSIDADLAVNPIRDLATLRQAGASAEDQRALLLDFQDALLLDVARAHYEVIRAERQVEVLQQSSKLQDERVSDAQARLQAGLVRPLDVTLSEAQAAQTATSLVEARVLARTARSELELLTAIALEGRTLIDELLVPERTPESSELLDQALRSRQDLLAADRRIIAASHLVESAYGQYFPAFSVNLQWFLQRDSSPTDLDWTSLFQLSLPLFSAGLIEADVRDALSQLRQAKLNFSLVSRRVQRDVDVALANLQASYERRRHIQVQVESASDALEQSVGLYEVGLATNLERLVAQNALLTAELDLINAELDSKVFYLDLLRTTGSLHESLGLQRDPVELLAKQEPPNGASQDHHAVAR